ncbi:MAG: sulfite exporter TauE/SafE family protein [Pseudomonadota bacterium]
MSGSVLDYIILIISAFFAGVLNTVAGGGSILTFPALVLVGVPPISASATSAMVVLPGYLGAAFGFRRELSRLGFKLLTRCIFIAVLGGLLGAQILLITPIQSFELIVPCLILFATALFGFSAPLKRWLSKRGEPVRGLETGSLLAVSTYGGFFNGGLGFLLMAVFSLRGFGLATTNALKSAMSFPLTLVSVSTFILAGVIEWAPAAAMMLASTLGGFSGSVVTKVLSPSILKLGVVFFGTTIGFAFLLDCFLP